jgi:hypothetical protein
MTEAIKTTTYRVIIYWWSPHEPVEPTVFYTTRRHTEPAYKVDKMGNGSMLEIFMEQGFEIFNLEKVQRFSVEVVQEAEAEEESP